MSLPQHMLAIHKSRNRRKCSILQVGGFRPTGHPLATRFGGALVGRPDEDWPSHYKQYFEGYSQKSGDLEFSSPLCQINLKEAPFVPLELEDYAMLTLFCATSDPDRHGFGGGPEPFAECVTVRAYKSLEGLSPLQPPERARLDWIKNMECRWHLSDDYPEYDDEAFRGPRRLSDDELETLFEALPNQYASKLGGYHSIIQGPAFDAATSAFVLQIADEPKINLSWTHSGVLGLGLAKTSSGELEWRADIQFY